MGAWLEKPVFTYGQLYVAASRIGNLSHLHIAINRFSDQKKRNVVYLKIINNYLFIIDDCIVDWVMEISGQNRLNEYCTSYASYKFY